MKRDCLNYSIEIFFFFAFLHSPLSSLYVESDCIEVIKNKLKNFRWYSLKTDTPESVKIKKGVTKILLQLYYQYHLYLHRHIYYYKTRCKIIRFAIPRILEPII